MAKSNSKKLLKGVTKSGFRYSIDPNVIRDMETLELMGEVYKDNPNPLAYPKLLTNIFGERQKKNLYAFCKKRYGKVDIEDVTNIVDEIFSGNYEKNF